MKKLTYGDKIYTRLILNGRNVVEFIIENISTMSELLGELRLKTREFKGLAKLYIRNMTQGWSIERPFMIYPYNMTRENRNLFSSDGTYTEKVRMRHHWEEYY